MNLSNLNEMQQQAVLKTQGPLLILAGAGSGKTRVITTRIAYLIEQGVAPVNILAITFTNKAAKEMGSRVEDLIGNKAKFIQISTFHSFCSKILRRESEVIDYSNNFTIYDTSDKMSLIKTIMDTMGIDKKMLDASTVARKISAAKDELISPDDYIEKYNYETIGGTIGTIYKKYNHELQKNNAMDFDDLIYNTVFIFKNFPNILKKYQEQYKYIMVDEYQDTNYGQYILVNLLSKLHKNICVVGDDDQSIYGWRGADVKNILDFEKDYENVTVIKLEQNYRSSSNIIDAAKKVIKNNGMRKDKSIWTSSSSGEKIQVVELENDIKEADYVASQIEIQKHEHNLKYTDFAILYRANSLSRKFEEALSLHGIPYRVFGGLKFFDRMEVKDLIAYLKIIDNPDDISLKRIINVPKRSIGAKSVEKLENYASQLNISLYDALQDAKEILGNTKAQKSIAVFYEIIEQLKKYAISMPTSELFEKLIEVTGYTLEYEQIKSPENNARLDNIGELKSLISEYEKTATDPTLRIFLQEAVLSTDMDTSDGQNDYVSLMTMHSAKGLEFDTVFVGATEEGIFPSSRSVMDQIKIEEERRLFYVAITRAKRRLYITRANRRMFYGQTNYNMKSRFLDEIGEEFAQQISEVYKNPYLSSEAEAVHKFASENSSLTDFYMNKYGMNRAQQKTLKTGAKVSHEKFGKGMIVGITGGKYSVLFDKIGIKIVQNANELTVM
ncbi:AAA family ATPase [Criibacterium bergeronii]|uniref:DNA 3'-5' helicase n=1 Tax=Criibacterium bergeronii TaxID=1871336 RepID=A0A552V6J5_9FIRM|nr:UvrD-helicase domain-containing protein [Criibacterium bergeronii]TRW26096.1 AAA family ATPase [Criibacterium bergeronii]